MATPYPYNITNDTASGSVLGSLLSTEIDASSIDTGANPIVSINTDDGGNGGQGLLVVTFTSALSGPDETTLIGRVAAHDGTPPAQPVDLNVAAVDPAVTDDEDSGYFAGSRWLNSALGTEHVCEDPAVDAAVWHRGAKAPAQVVTVAKSGGDFTSVAAANASITDAGAAKPYVVMIYPGVYVESPWSMQQYVSYVGSGQPLDVVLKTNDNDADFITGIDLSTLANLSIEGPTGVGFAAVHHSVVSVYPLIVNNVLLRAGYYGLWADGSVPGSGRANIHAMIVGNHYNGTTINQMFRVEDDAFLSAFFCTAMSGPGSAVTTGFYITGAAELRGNLLSYRLGGTGIFADDGADVIVEGLVLNHAAYGIDVGATGTGTSVRVVAGDARSGLTETLRTQVGSDAVVSFTGAAHKETFPNIAEPRNVVATFVDETFKETGLVTIGDHNIGSENFGRSLTAGEGRSHTRNLAVLTNTNGEVGTWADIVADLLIDDGASQTMLPGLGTANTVFVGGAIPFTGLLMQVATALVEGAGILAARYWNGSSWIALDLMANDTATLVATAGAFWQSVNVEDIRFGDTTGWATKSLNGVTRYWVEFTVETAAITTAPVLDYIKLHTNHFKVRGDGIVESYGTGSEYAALAETIENFLKGTNKPGNFKILVSTNIDADTKENLYENGALDERSGKVQIPPGVDTSFPLQVDWTWMPRTTDTGDVELEVFYEEAGLSFVYDGASADAVVKKVVAASGVIDQPVTTTFEIPITDLMAGDFLWLSFKRDASGGNLDDTFVGDVVALAVQLRAKFWRK